MEKEINNFYKVVNNSSSNYDVSTPTTPNIAWAGLVLNIIAFIFSWGVFFNFMGSTDFADEEPSIWNIIAPFTALIGLAGLICSIIGVNKKNSNKRVGKLGLWINLSVPVLFLIIFIAIMFIFINK